MIRTILLMILVAAQIGCSVERHIVVASQTNKQPHTNNNIEREQAIQYFWKQFHAGNYHNIEQILVQLKSQYLINPNDPKLALLIGHTHFWKVAERFRLQNISPNITDHLTLAKKYFEEALKLNPEDDRILGWLSGVKIAEATVHNDDIDKINGYYDGLESIEKYPEFNHFSIGYVMSNQDYSSDQFQKAVDWYFKSMDLAYHTTIARDNPELTAEHLSLATSETNLRLKRAVWNSGIAPHNVEGFYLNFGDFLVKNNQLKQAKIIYQNAQKIPGYETWKYKQMLENRLLNIEQNTLKFKESFPQNLVNTTEDFSDSTMIFNSYNCMACHQK